MFAQAWDAVWENEFPIDITTAAKITTPGSTIVVAVWSGSFNSIADGDVTDSKGNTYTRVGNVTTTIGKTMALFWSANVLGGSGHTLRFQRGDSSDGVIAGVELSSMLAASHDVDLQVPDTTGTVFNTGNLNTSALDDLVAIFTTDDNAGVWAAGSGFTLRASFDTGTSVQLMIATKDGVAAGTVSASATKSGASISYAAVLSAFKASVGGGGTPPRPRYVGI